MLRVINKYVITSVVSIREVCLPVTRSFSEIIERHGNRSHLAGWTTMFGERGPSLLMTAVKMVVKWLRCVTGLTTSVTSLLEYVFPTGLAK